jgi:hypothetical protein
LFNDIGTLSIRKSLQCHPASHLSVRLKEASLPERRHFHLPPPF